MLFSRMHTSYTARQRAARVLLVTFMAISLAACAAKSGKEEVNVVKTSRPGETELAYGMGIVLPSGWKVVNSLKASAASKQSLDTRRQAGERILALESLGPKGLRGFESMIGIFVVNQDGTFMPREYAQKLKPEEFTSMSRDLLAREKSEAKKKKTQSGLLDVQILREDIAGHLAISQRMLVVGPDGKPVRLVNWDVYLPNGAGAAIKTVCDPEHPSAESDIATAVKGMRFE